MLNAKELFQRRRQRVRNRLRRDARGQPRLSVFRSNKHIYAQIIDDTQGRTIAAASSLDETLGTSAKGGNIEAAKAVGKLIADRALKAGLKDVVFDRGGYIYHGRVKALAEAAREAGLKF